MVVIKQVLFSQNRTRNVSFLSLKIFSSRIGKRVITENDGIKHCIVASFTPTLPSQRRTQYRTAASSSLSSFALRCERSILLITSLNFLFCKMGGNHLFDFPPLGFCAKLMECYRLAFPASTLLTFLFLVLYSEGCSTYCRLYGLCPLDSSGNSSSWL